MEDEQEELQRDFREEAIESFRGIGIEPPSEAPRKKKLKNTFLNMGDPEPFEDDDFEFEADTHEELSSLAHGELEHHREMRHYARLAAWEMPLLSSMLLLTRRRSEQLLMLTQNLRSHSFHQQPICR